MNLHGTAASSKYTDRQQSLHFKNVRRAQVYLAGSHQRPICSSILFPTVRWDEKIMVVDPREAKTMTDLEVSGSLTPRGCWGTCRQLWLLYKKPQMLKSRNCHQILTLPRDP